MSSKKKVRFEKTRKNSNTQAKNPTKSLIFKEEDDDEKLDDIDVVVNSKKDSKNSKKSHDNPTKSSISKKSNSKQNNTVHETSQKELEKAFKEADLLGGDDNITDLKIRRRKEMEDIENDPIKRAEFIKQQEEKQMGVSKELIERLNNFDGGISVDNILENPENIDNTDNTDNFDNTVNSKKNPENSNNDLDDSIEDEVDDSDREIDINEIISRNSGNSNKSNQGKNILQTLKDHGIVVIHNVDKLEIHIHNH